MAGRNHWELSLRKWIIKCELGGPLKHTDNRHVYVRD